MNEGQCLYIGGLRNGVQMFRKQIVELQCDYVTFNICHGVLCAFDKTLFYSLILIQLLRTFMYVIKNLSKVKVNFK